MSDARVDLLVDCLACYRLSRLVTRDTITAPARDWIEARSVIVVGERYTSIMGAPVCASPTRVVDRQPYAFLRDLTDCPWCVSVWLGPLVLLLPRWVRRALALSAVAGLVTVNLDPSDERDDT